MFDKLKNIELKTIFKFLGVGILFIIFIAIALGIISAIFTNFNLNFGGGSRDYGQEISYPGQQAMMSKNSSSVDFAASNIQGVTSMLENNTSAPIVNESAYEVKTYSATIDSSKVEEDCNKLISLLDKEYTKTDNINISKHYCNLNVKILKGSEQKFIAILKEFNLKDLNSNIVNIVKSYSGITDRIEVLKKRLDEVDLLLTESKTSYNELWNSLKIKNVSPESIDSLNKIIQNKSDLIVRFSNDKQNLMDQIDGLTKQKEEYNEQLKYIEFSIYFRERLIVDFETIKDQWYADYKAMISTFNETLQNLTVNLVSFLLRTLNVVIYIVLGIFFILVGGKGVYKMGRRIIFGKENQDNKAKKQ